MSRYLEKGINDPEPKTCTDLSQQAKRLLGKIKEQKKSNADGYSDFRHTITHELMHTKTAGKAAVSGQSPASLLKVFPYFG